MDAPEKSSFIKNEMSLEDAIKQIYRPRKASIVQQGLAVFERLVSDCETVTRLGEKLVVKGQSFHLTPNDLEKNLDEFGELKEIATQGRAMLLSLGYVSLVKNVPAVGIAPVGVNTEVLPITTQLPGAEPLEGVIVRPK